MYAVFNGSHYNNRCCFDYGNAETNNHDDGAGTMEAVYFGSAKGGLNHGGAGKGPWIMADMENALSVQPLPLRLLSKKLKESGCTAGGRTGSSPTRSPSTTTS